jgi:hypothetical protein
MGTQSQIANFLFVVSFLCPSNSEEKSEQIEILREEIQECKVEVNKLRYQNQELTNRASLANIYCEEIETLREKSLKADKYEHEMNKYKDMLEPFDLFKQHLEVNYWI